MLLVALVICIASLVLYMGFNTVKTTNEKILMIIATILLVGLLMKYMVISDNMKESFKVKMEDEEFINEVEKLDEEAMEKFETAENSDNSVINKNNKESNTFSPTLIINVPEEDEKVVIRNNGGNPFEPVPELFKNDDKCKETFKEEEPNKYLPFANEVLQGIKKYTSRDFVPGMAFIPPTEWEVPQPHKKASDCTMVCNQTMPDTRRLPIAMMDYGTPINALELGPDGMIAKREEDAPLTSVGSIMPKFEYREYVECHSYNDPKSPGVAAAATTITQKQ